MLGPAAAATATKGQQPPPQGANLRKGRKELANRYYQPLSGHASIGYYLARIGRTPTNEC